jgi:hypothetical protein
MVGGWSLTCIFLFGMSYLRLKTAQFHDFFHFFIYFFEGGYDIICLNLNSHFTNKIVNCLKILNIIIQLLDNLMKLFNLWYNVIIQNALVK